MNEGIHIALAPETIGNLWGIPITNTLITSWVVVLILLTAAFFVGRRVALVPGKGQILFESLFEYVLTYMEETLESRKLAIRFFPLIATIFLFILTANLIEFTPGIGSVGFFSATGGPGFGGEHSEFTPLLRSVNTDLNMTLALAIISFLVIEVTGIFVIGALKYAKKFVNFKSPLSFMIGVIDLFSEIARLISFSFRLFGNIFAGEVLILIVYFFVPYVLPVPLMLFEIFVGFIQAAIFALLTLFFIKIAITEHH